VALSGLIPEVPVLERPAQHVEQLQEIERQIVALGEPIEARIVRLEPETFGEWLERVWPWVRRS